MMYTYFPGETQVGRLQRNYENFNMFLVELKKENYVLSKFDHFDIRG